MPLTRMVPILMYHALDNTRSPISLPHDRFQEQMAWLKVEGCRVWTLSDLLGWLAAGRPPTDPAVVLTFDDGFRSILTHGLPVLARYGFRATVFVTTGHVGGRNDWGTQPAGIPHWELLSWTEVRELASAGMEIGAHSVTHPWLPALPISAARREILESKATIEDALGQPVRSFAYPYGAYTDAIRTLVVESFQCACTASLRRVGARCDPWALPRIDAHYAASRLFFRSLWSRALTPWLSARRGIRWVRGLPQSAQEYGTA